MVSSARGVISAEARRTAGYRPGDTWLVTNLCVFRYDEAAGQLVVVETMPGVSRETISAETGFKVLFCENCKPMEPPTPEELRVLREEIDPLGIRRLEFVGAKERGALLDEILARDLQGTIEIASGVG
jgi:glutaconate CoA-transferase subunit A